MELVARLFVVLVNLTVAMSVVTAQSEGVTRQEALELRDEVKSMFYHAYNSYMEHAFPLDELRPLSCSGEDSLGGYSLTLIDAMDTLALLGDVKEFSKAVKWISHNVDFDKNKTVSIFETNIRVLGGLLSAHLLASDPSTGMAIDGYDGKLLELATDLGRRFLPAFYTPTGIPFGSVNLQNGVPPEETTVTSTAAGGTLAVEFGMLSRLTSDPVFEDLALQSLRGLWSRRSPLGLVGAHIDVYSGEWTHRDAGIGTSIDSFYEYLLKAHLLLGNDEYLHMFTQAYQAALQHLHVPPWYLEVNMDDGMLVWPLFNSLQAFWPGLQVLAGDVEAAAETHAAFYGVWRRFGFTPEGFNLLSGDVQPGQTSYPLRPELAESTYWLYRATRDPMYLHVGRDIITSIQYGATCPCGYCHVSEVKTHEKEDHMESFFLSETVKYLWLLFDSALGGDNLVENGPYPYVFSTEGHLFPIRPDLSLEKPVVNFAPNETPAEANGEPVLAEPHSEVRPKIAGAKAEGRLQAESVLVSDGSVKETAEIGKASAKASKNGPGMVACKSDASFEIAHTDEAADVTRTETTVGDFPKEGINVHKDVISYPRSDGSSDGVNDLTWDVSKYRETDGSDNKDAHASDAVADVNVERPGKKSTNAAVADGGKGSSASVTNHLTAQVADPETAHKQFRMTEGKVSPLPRGSGRPAGGLPLGDFTASEKGAPAESVEGEIVPIRGQGTTTGGDAATCPHLAATRSAGIRDEGLGASEKAAEAEAESDVSRKALGDISKNVEDDVSRNAKVDVSRKVKDDVSTNVIDGVSGGALGDVNKNVTEDGSKNVTDASGGGADSWDVWSDEGVRPLVGRCPQLSFWRHVGVHNLVLFPPSADTVTNLDQIQIRSQQRQMHQMRMATFFQQAAQTSHVAQSEGQRFTVTVNPKGQLFFQQMPTPPNVNPPPKPLMTPPVKTGNGEPPESVTTPFERLIAPTGNPLEALSNDNPTCQANSDNADTQKTG